MMQLLLKQLDLNGVQAVPEGHEGESEEEAEGAPELCHQGGPGVDQLLRLHVGPVKQGDQGEDNVIRFDRSQPLLPIEGILPVEARLHAPCQLENPFKVSIINRPVKVVKVSGTNF